MPRRALRTGLLFLLVGVYPTPAGGAESEPVGKVKRLQPANGTVLLQGMVVRIAAELELAPGPASPITIRPRLVVNGCLQPSPTIALTPGATVAGTVSWDVCVVGPVLTVQLDVIGEERTPERAYEFKRVVHTYPVAKLEVPRCCKAAVVGCCRVRR
jgi:hypothetical protein